MTSDRATRFGIDMVTDPDFGLWQGMLLKRTNSQERGFVFVLSADCDLLHDKGDGDILVLDAIPIEHYIITSIIPAVSGQLASICIESVREVAVAREEAFAKVSEEALSEWVCVRNGQQLRTELPGLHADEENWLLQLAEKIQTFSSANGQGQAKQGQQQRTLKIVPSVPGNKARCDKLEKKFRAMVDAKLSPARADVYLLPNIPSSNSSLGYIVPFKSIHTMPRANVTASVSSSHHMKEGYVPHANCRPVLTHSLLQKFSLYFGRIGLSREFEGDQKALTALAMEELFR